MANVSGTVKSVTLLQGSLAAPEQSGVTTVRKVYRLGVDFGQYTASADTARITGVPTAIGSVTKSGRTVTLRAAMGGTPGRTAAGAAVYAQGVFTNSSGTLDFELGGTTAEADSAACTDVGVIVTVDETVAA